MSSSHERAVKGYLTPKNNVIFKAYASVEGLKCSELINIMAREFFQKLPPEKKQEYISKSTGGNSYK